MNTIRLSATAARNRFFQLLDQISQGTTEVIIERDKKEVAVLSPKKTQTDWEGLLKASKKVHGIFRGLSIEEINPLSKKDAWKGFGEWDKGLEKRAKKRK